MTYLLRNASITDSLNTEKGDILIQDGRIANIAPHIPASQIPQDAETLDLEGMVVMPGIVDAHTHYGLVSRGTVTADGFEEGSRLAAYGGVTTVVDFADHIQGSSLSDAAESRAEAMLQDMAIDLALHQCVFRMNSQIPPQLDDLVASGVTAIKIFTTYRQAGYLIEREGLRDLFKACRDRKILVTVHAEDDVMIERIMAEHTRRAEQLGDENPFPPSAHPELRPSTAEAEAIRAMAELSRELRMPIYIVHVSSREGIEEILRQRAAGAEIIVETTPHYLLLDRSALLGEEGALALMTPPLRDSDDNQALWDAVDSEDVDIIATDHCAFDREQKLSSHDCRIILPGIPGTEELLPLIHTFGVCSGRITMERLVGLLSTNPARMFGLFPRKGSLRIGTDADIVVFDPRVTWTITGPNQHTAAGYTPYEGLEITGKVIHTMRRGEFLVRDGVYRGEPGTGEFLPAAVSYGYHHKVRH